MTVKRTVLSVGVATAMISSTAAFAGQTSHAGDFLSSQKTISTYAMGHRSSDTISKNKSNLEEVGERSDRADGRYVIAGLGIIVVVGGIIIAIDNDNDSPG